MKNSKCRDVTSNIDFIKAMYTRFTKQPEQLKKLEELRSMKHRASLLPSEKDMRILGEAHVLSQNYKVYFVTDDKDFIYFKNEIQKELNIVVIELLELPHFTL